MKGSSMSQSSSCGDTNYLANVDEFSAKFSLQGTSSSKTTGKRKVVSKIVNKNICLKSYVLL